MDKTGDEAASKFISALIKSVQTLCHGYLDFQTGIEIIGHINLSVDKGSSLDYILKEKVCKNAENSTLFISNSFHAEPKSEQEVPGKQGQAGNQTVQNSEVADSGDSSKVSSAISSISSNLTGIRDRRQHSSGAKDSDSSYSHYRAGKRKASSDQMNDVCPAKVSSHHDSSRLSSDSPYRPNSSSPVDSKLGLQGLQTADGESSETMLPQTANVTDGSDIGVNLAGSVLEPVESQSNTDLPERDEDSDGDLEVTFIKEEYVEGDRSACEFDSSGQQYLGPHDRNSEGMPDPSVFPVALHSGSAPSTYVPSGHDPGAVGQQYPGGVPSQPQPGPSGSRGNVSQQQAAQPLPPGARPGCGYVHPSDAQKWRDRGGREVSKAGSSSGSGGSTTTTTRGGTEPKNVSKEELERLLGENLSIKDMAQRLGMSRPTLYKLLKKHRLECAFKHTTNEQIVEMMGAVVMEFPQALTDPGLMNQRLMLSGVLAVSEKRLLSCMRRLQREINLTF
ncbi:uncharacterized protein LOC143293555 isoform X6 [Babylonia areolata]|uniref:uncharacterized protein LOC143293555 isoform X6 n=1 Tax=Babylonia areolata TaxID=304850 RepID=UPI003FD61949